jgi:hypothetical protein
MVDAGRAHESPILPVQLRITRERASIGPMRFVAARWLAAAALLFGLLGAGCGGTSGPSDNGISKETPAQIIADVRAAVASATSVHIVGAGSSGGTNLALDLQLVAGKGGAGRVSYSGLTIQIVRIGQKLYFKGSEAFLHQYAGAAAPLLAGRWFVVSASRHGFASFGPLTDLVSLTGHILASHGALAKGETTTIRGQPALAITDTTGGGTLYVATTGPAYPLELRPRTGKTGLISFSNWDKPVALTAPPSPVDYAKLTGG